jgi:hypothetical protein
LLIIFSDYKSKVKISSHFGTFKFEIKSSNKMNVSRSHAPNTTGVDFTVKCLLKSPFPTVQS